MKYVKVLKNNEYSIFEVIEEYENLKTIQCKLPTCENGYIIIGKNNVIAEADTIEELCDEFVGIDKTCVNGHQLLRAIPYKCANFWNGGVYGAIWTDKGLIYVAKMNDKGELELIWKN